MSPGPPSALGSLDSEGTTVSCPPALTERGRLPGGPEWAADLEWVWRAGTAAERTRWELRARELRDVDRRRADYAEARARGLALSRADRVAACGGRWRTVACACGTAAVPVGCDLPALCTWCSRRHWRVWRKRLTRGLRDAMARELVTWGKRGRGLRPRPYLLTLTVPHSGDLVVDRRRLGDGWRRLYQHANARAWWSTYAATYEATPGSSGDGHVHMHVVLISSWVPFDELHVAWRAALRLRADEPHVLDIRARLDDGRSVSDTDAASYVSKYVTKGIHPGEFTGQKAGELLVAFRRKRRVTTSAGFWRPVKRCDTCASRYRLVELPPGLKRHAAGACWRVLSRLTQRGQRALDLGPDPPRGDPSEAIWRGPVT